MFNSDFYPTPKAMVDKMLEGVDFSKVSTVLEPSAGKGDILDVVMARYKHFHYRRKPDIDAIEIEPELRHILKGKGYRVVHDDFLTFGGHKRYDLILMNPPFSEGDKHLMKALEFQRKGGMVVCLLNAETLRNPYTHSRRELQELLKKLDADIEYIPGAFKHAERRTGVEVALVKVAIEPANEDGIIISGLKQQGVFTGRERYQNQMTSSDFLEAIIQRYNFEVRAGVRLLEEYFSMRPLIMNTFDPDSYPRPILTLRIEGAGIDYNAQNLELAVNEYLKVVRYKYWRQLFQSKEFMNLLTSDLQQELQAKVSELVDFDFSYYNIIELKLAMSKKLLTGVEEAIIELFDEFSSRHHWSEYSKNVHYYNGWKTNQAWYINKRVIIPLNAYGWSGFRPTDYKVMQKLMDIEKVFDYLDGGRTDHVSLVEILERAKEEDQTKKIKLKYFYVTFYKKGTCHIEFTDLDLLKKFNLFGSQRKNWLPPGYGKKSYEQMTPEERAVVDSFEGKESYEKVMQNKRFYLAGDYSLPMLEMNA